MFMYFVSGITAVSTAGGLVNAIVNLDTKGTSGPVTILNRILPDNAVSSPRTVKAGASMAARIPIVTPGGQVSILPRSFER